jgi:dihydroorotase
VKILISGGRIIDPIQKVSAFYDLEIENGIITAWLEPNKSKSKHDKVIDANNKLIIPGLIDLHVHLREPGFEWKETVSTGSKAAILGGFTSICAMPNTRPVNDHSEITQFILKQASKTNLARVLPIGAVTQGLKGEKITPLAELKKSGCVAFSDDGEPIYNSGIMRRALEWAKQLNATISCHEEDKALSAKGCMNESGLSYKLGLKGMHTVAEDVMIARDIELSLLTGANVHICHVSSTRGVELIRRAKKDGINITCEVTPHHLFLTEDAVANYDTNFKMSPPLRDQDTQNALWEGVLDGTIDAIASDHAPHELDSKSIEFELASFGILGLQTTLPLILSAMESKKLDEIRAIELMTSSPARCFNLPYGRLQVGSVADIAIIDPNETWVFNDQTNASKSINSPFWNKSFKGRASTVLVAGEVKLENGVVNENI